MSAATKHIMFVIATLQGGGAERVVCTMANYWADKGHKVSIATFAAKGQGSAYPLHENVSLSELDILGKKHGAISDNVSRIKSIRAFVQRENPDHVVSFMESTNVLVMLATMGLGVPVTISDRIDPKAYNYGAVWRLLRNVSYHFADHFVVQTKDVTESYPASLGRKAAIIPNFVNALPAAPAVQRDNVVCAMGRLTKQKGFDVLLSAFAALPDQNDGWGLEIYGEGEDGEALKTLSQDLGISDRVSFKGFTDDVPSVMNRAGIFVLSSRYEGFPNVLLEAMAFAVPVISTDCRCGPKEIIENNKNGLLVPNENVKKLSAQLSLLMQDSALREKLGNEAVKVREDYSIGRIMKMWEELVCAA